MIGKLLYYSFYLSTIGAKSVLKFHDSLEYQNKIPRSTDSTSSDSQHFTTSPSFREENCDSDESTAAEVLQSTLENNFNLKVPPHMVDAQEKRQVYEMSEKGVALQNTGSKKNTDVESERVEGTIPILGGDVNSNQVFAEHQDDISINIRPRNNAHSDKQSNDSGNDISQYILDHDKKAEDLQKTKMHEHISNGAETSGLNVSNNIPEPESLPIIKHSITSTTYTIEDEFVTYSMPITPAIEATPYTIATLNEVPAVQSIGNHISQEQTDFLEESHTIDDGDNDIVKNHFTEKTENINERIHEDSLFPTDRKSVKPTFKIDFMPVTESPSVMNNPTPTFSMYSIKNIANKEPKKIINVLATEIAMSDSNQLNNNEDNIFLTNDNEHSFDVVKEQDEDLAIEADIKSG